MALKFLPEAVARDPQSLARFQVEAQAASALNHPNICTVYDIGEQDGEAFIAMEFLDGLPLKHRIAGRPWKSERCWRWESRSRTRSTQHTTMASFTATLIRQTFLSPSAETPRFSTSVWPSLPQPMKLDVSGNTFGGVTQSPEDLARPGSALGTIPYMSPEQALGRPLDSRTDLFSFGVVLYEMATGVLPFQGQTTAAFFDSLIHSVPEWPLRFNPATPPELERIVRKTLEKDPAQRYQSAAEMRVDLQRLRKEIESGQVSAAGTGPRAGAGFERENPRSVRHRLPQRSHSTQKKVCTVGRWLGLVAIAVLVAAILFLRSPESPADR